jgi:hypothetical protein
MEGVAVVFLIVGLDRATLARWHTNVMARDAAAAADIARARAAAQGVTLVVAAAVGPYSSIVDEPARAAAPRAA